MSKNNRENKGPWEILDTLLKKGDLIALPVAWVLLLARVAPGRFKVVGYICVGLLSLLALVLRTKVGRLVLKEIGKAVNDRLVPLIRNKFRPEWKPHHLIDWLTRGKIDGVVTCHERTDRRLRIFGAMRCRRETCRFSLEKERIPHLLLWNLPRAAKSVKHIHLSAYQVVMKERQLSCPGVFEQWDCSGITIRMDSTDWRAMQRSLHDSYGFIPHVLTVHIPTRFPREVRMQIQPQKEHAMHDGSVILFGKYVDALETVSIKRDDKRWLSIPICQAWEAQGRRPEHCKYADDAPDRLKTLA